MNADKLKSALKEVGFTDEEVANMSLQNAKKVYIAKINSMVPEGSEDEPDIPEHLVDVYNRVDEIEDWHEPTVGYTERREEVRKKPKKDPADYKKRGPKPKVKDNMPNKTMTPPNYRGRAVKVNRIMCVLEALRIGGTRDEILVMADKLFVKKGGGSNIFQTTQQYMNAMQVLKALNLMFVDAQGKIKLKQFTAQ